MREARKTRSHGSPDREKRDTPPSSPAFSCPNCAHLIPYHKLSEAFLSDLSEGEEISIGDLLESAAAPKLCPSCGQQVELPTKIEDLVSDSPLCPKCWKPVTTDGEVCEDCVSERSLLERLKGTWGGLFFIALGAYGISVVVRSLKTGTIRISSSHGSDYHASADGWEAFLFWPEVIFLGLITPGFVLLGIFWVYLSLFPPSEGKSGRKRR
jgi:hypothetical protein